MLPTKNFCFLLSNVNSNVTLKLLFSSWNSYSTVFRHCERKKYLKEVFKKKVFKLEEIFKNTEYLKKSSSHPYFPCPTFIKGKAMTSRRKLESLPIAIASHYGAIESLLCHCSTLKRGQRQMNWIFSFAEYSLKSND